MRPQRTIAKAESVAVNTSLSRFAGCLSGSPASEITVRQMSQQCSSASCCPKPLRWLALSWIHLGEPTCLISGPRSCRGSHNWHSSLSPRDRSRSRGARWSHGLGGSHQELCTRFEPRKANAWAQWGRCLPWQEAPTRASVDTQRWHLNLHRHFRSLYLILSYRRKGW